MSNGPRLGRNKKKSFLREEPITHQKMQVVNIKVTIINTATCFG